MVKSSLLATLACFGVGACASPGPSMEKAKLAVPVYPAADMRLEWLGQTVLAPDFLDGTLLGGLSGLTYSQTTGQLVAISDDPGLEQKRGPARLYQLDLTLGPTQVEVHPKKVKLVSGLRKGSVDFEAIVALQRGYLLSSEGETDQLQRQREGDASALSHPQLVETDLNGKVARTVALPARFQPEPGGEHGIAINQGVEGLSQLKDHFMGARWAIITEAGLRQDRPSGALHSRLALFNLQTNSESPAEMGPAVWNQFASQWGSQTKNGSPPKPSGHAKP